MKTLYLRGITLFFALFLFGSLLSQNLTVVPCDSKSATAFAIFVDNATYRACKAEIEAYRDVLQSEGLGTYILASDWETPEDVKAQIIRLSKRKPLLEGMVFIGDIPVVRVRQGQHLTTAFKMNEDTFPMEESSVTSDRFYDDLHLRFEFIGRDSVQNRHFYYNLTEKGAQKLRPNFYSSRMMVPADFPADPYQTLQKYLIKVVEAHKEVNPLDHFIAFSGHGYNSDCLTVWSQLPLVFKEYFPSAFEKASGNKFYNFRQAHPMKYILFTEMQRPETDVFLLSEHGDYDTQYINGEFPANSFEQQIEQLERTLRSYYRRLENEEKESFVDEVATTYHLDKGIFSDQAMEAHRIEDSLASADVNIVLDDIRSLKTGARLILFNACYNGSFHKEGYVAGYHLFNDGKNIVSQGNTVNSLQDRWVDQLLGYLPLGVRVGFWQKEIPFLETHLLGDPTYRFSTAEQMPADTFSLALARSSYMDDLAIKDKGFGSTVFWRGMLQKDESVFRAAAIKHLANRKAISSEELRKIFEQDASWAVRLQTLTAIAPFADAHARAVVLKGLNDPYEMIRRESCHLAGKMGAPEFVKPLIAIEEQAHEVTRAQYAASSALSILNPQDLPSEDVIADKNASPKQRESAIRSLRNYPLHWKTDALLDVMQDASQDDSIRILLAEALGWFNYSIERPQIVATLSQIIKEQHLNTRLEREIRKTLLRLQ